MEKTSKLSEMEKDALREMANIGTGNAVTELSKFINQNININVPEVKFIPLKQFSDEFGGPENVICGIYLKISGDFNGEALFIFPRESALQLVDILMGRELGATKEFDEMDESAFKETANIIGGAYLNAISQMLDAKILPSVPYTATDMAQAVFDVVLINVSKHADEMLCIKTKMDVVGHNITAEFIVLFDTLSLRKMLQVLHQKYGSVYS